MKKQRKLLESVKRKQKKKVHFILHHVAHNCPGHQKRLGQLCSHFLQNTVSKPCRAFQESQTFPSPEPPAPESLAHTEMLALLRRRQPYCAGARSGASTSGLPLGFPSSRHAFVSLLLSAAVTGQDLAPAWGRAFRPRGRAREEGHDEVRMSVTFGGSVARCGRWL